MKTKLNLLLRLFAAVQCFVAATAVWAQSASLLRTLPNPTPASGDSFGFAVSASPAGWLVVGAPYDDTAMRDAGTVYILSTNGTLLTTIPNPQPAQSDAFGYAVAAGPDWVAVGAQLDDRGATDAGTVYVFSTNGTLLATIPNPTPESYDLFGCAVAALGPDLLVAGARADSSDGINTGIAYLCSTNGSILNTFANPTPGMADNFGGAIAPVGTDYVLIGAYADDRGALDSGEAYLFDTNCVLVTTFTNPAPGTSEYFGFALAAVGTDRVLISAYGDHTGAADAGAAYLFNTNGTLLTTFTNPAPAVNDWFGYSVAAVGPEHVLIGAYMDDLVANNAGSAFLFSAYGVLLTTITNPTPAVSDCFGQSMSVPDAHWGVISAPADGTGAAASGSVYLFKLQTDASPPLTVRRSGDAITVSWPRLGEGWVLEQTNALPQVPAPWPQVLPPYQTNGAYLQVTEPVSTGTKFYRLRKP